MITGPMHQSKYLLVTYVTIEGAGGQKRIWLHELVEWFANHPGTLIVNMRVLP